MTISKGLFTVLALVAATESLGESTAATDAAQPEPLALMSKAEADKKLDVMYANIAAARANTAKKMASLEEEITQLEGLAGSPKAINKLAESIEGHVKPLSPKQRKHLEKDYEKKLHAMKAYNLPTKHHAAPLDKYGQHGFLKLQHEADHAASKLYYADRDFARELMHAVLTHRRHESKRVMGFVKDARKALKGMGNPTKVELTEEKAGRHESQYDHDEHALESEKSKASETISMHGMLLFDVVDDIYKKVEDIVVVRSDSIEEAAAKERDFRHEGVVIASWGAPTASLIQETSGDDNLASAPLQDKNTIAAGAAFVMVAALGALAGAALQRRRNSEVIVQPMLLA